VFGIGWTEFIVIALILLVFVGPKHLPGLLRKLGRITAELRSASRELRNQIDIEVDDLQSPAQIVDDVKQAAIDSVNAEYEGVREADAELRRELEQLADPYVDAGEPAAPKATGTGDGETANERGATGQGEGEP
jgi:sec-independent protein translocase protein TatB